MSEERSVASGSIVNRNGDELVEFILVGESELENLDLDVPVTSSFVVARCQTGFLLVFNRWKRRWELPGGMMEPGETPRACALRELEEETNQRPTELRFKGLLRLRLQPSKRIQYRALYSCQIDQLEPFQADDEIEGIVVWDLRSDIGYIEEISRALIECHGAT